MSQEEILKCILDPNHLKEISFDRLKKALIDYPYSQNLHFLLTQKSMQEQHPDFERHLKTTATYMSSRSFLRKQLQQVDKPSQPFFQAEPEAEPAQGNSTTIPSGLETDFSGLSDEDLPPVEFIPDILTDLDPPNHVADIITETPPADPPPPNETPDQVENTEKIEHLPPIVVRINPLANQVEDPEIAPVEKKIPISHEPNAEQPRIIKEGTGLKVESEEPSLIGTNVTDLVDSEPKEFLDPESEIENKLIETTESSFSEEELEIIEFPEAFDFEDEMDDLLSKPLIEVIPESFVNSQKDSEQELDDEDSVLDLEEFDELLLPENFDGPQKETQRVKPEGKWIKKYKDSDDKGKEKSKNRGKKKKSEKESKKKVKNKSQKTKKKNNKKRSNPKNEGKKKKKNSEQKLSKKKAIRKFANRSIVEDGETISITLADLYVKQGKIEKAIIAYERLSLIIPEKKAFFASLIKKLKKK